MESVRSLIWVLVLTFPAFLQAYALSPGEIRAEIQAQVSQRHPDPPSNFWARLGPEALPVIREMLSSNPSLLERTWLIEGLGHFTDPSVGPILESEIRASGNAVLRKKMISSLIRSQGEQELDFVTPYLQDPDPHVRLETAKAIRLHMSGSRAAGVLKRFEESHAEPWMKRELDSVRPGEGVPVKARISQMRSTQEGSELEPLKEVEWVGDWEGVWVSEKRSGRASARLSRTGTRWKVELKLPKQSKIELNSGDLEIVSHPSRTGHWIEIRNKKEDSVFLAFRKTKRP